MSKEVTTNAGKYNRRIIIYQVVDEKDKDGFPVKTEVQVLKTDRKSVV